jgi:predicted oxidoreductase (fatty acid repression mutant protein)
MQKFIKITTGNYLIVHGFDQDNKEIIEEVRVEKPMLKVVAIDRIQSISEKYVLVTSAFGRLLYWEYEESFEELTQQFERYNLLVV